MASDVFTAHCGFACICNKWCYIKPSQLMLPLAKGKKTASTASLPHQHSDQHKASGVKKSFNQICIKYLICQAFFMYLFCYSVLLETAGNVGGSTAPPSAQGQKTPCFCWPLHLPTQQNSQQSALCHQVFFEDSWEVLSVEGTSFLIRRKGEIFIKKNKQRNSLVGKNWQSEMGYMGW